jgi:hypothetical protein
MSQHNIDLNELTGAGKVRNLSGHDKGSAARKRFDLDALDRLKEPVSVVVPEDVYAISSSFVQGMFASSLTTLGSLAAFFDHYQFRASGSIIRQIERGLAAKRMAAA